MLKTWQITNSKGNQATILNFGARLIDWSADITQGRNIIVGFDHVEDYLQDGACMGAIAGPYANRIGGATVSIEDKIINLGANEGENHLHGAQDGLQSVFWQLHSVSNNSLTLTHQHIASSGPSYPGNIQFQITYLLTENNELLIKLNAETDQLTPIGPTGHAYFNLGDQTQTIDTHKLQIKADSYTPVDDANIPTGEIAELPQEMDFSAAKPVSIRLDHNFVVSDHDSATPVAKLCCDESDLSLEVFSDYPGVQIYTADHMGSPFISRNAICIEPQYFPDSPNKAQFPFEFTGPGKPFNKFIGYRLSTI